MIGYQITKSDLEALIENEKPGWLQKARDRTEEFRQKGFYEESSSIWGEIKVVYMLLQGRSKCAYCERKLESTDFGKIEQDVEHFRPKSSVRKWRMPKELKDNGVVATNVPSQANGYHLLPYHVFNYAAACKPCNSILKKDYFPIASAYKFKGENPSAMLDEKPFLIYPIGDFDDDPETLIQFNGVSPHAVAKDGHKRMRALLTIEFFKLDDTEKRRNLMEDRARIIVAVYPQLEKIQNNVPEPDLTDANDVVRGFTSPRAPHTNCARSFKRLFEQNPVEAKEVYKSAVKLIGSIS